MDVIASMPMKRELVRSDSAFNSVRNNYIFLVYYVNETEPFRPRELRMLTTNTLRVRAFLEDQILKGNVQYGEMFSSASQLKEFRKDWTVRQKGLLNHKMRYAAISAAVDGKELKDFKLSSPFNQTVYDPIYQGDSQGYIFLAYSMGDRTREVYLFTSNPKRLRTYFEDHLSKGEFRYGDSDEILSQLEEFSKDWKTKPKSYINSKLKGCAMTAVRDGKVLDMFSLS